MQRFQTRLGELDLGDNCPSGDSAGTEVVSRRMKRMTYIIRPKGRREEKRWRREEGGEKEEEKRREKRREKERTGGRGGRERGRKGEEWEKESLPQGVQPHLDQRILV